MVKSSKENIQKINQNSGNMVYCLGVIGAVVYYLQIADGFWPSVLAILKAFVWPAFAVYDLLKFLAS